MLAVTVSPLKAVHTPSSTDFSRVMVSTWSVSTSLSSVSGLMLIRTSTQSLSASGSVVLALIEAPSTVPPAQSASIVVEPAVGDLMVTVH